jgi:lipopolysaccharide transport system permease protein
VTHVKDPADRGGLPRPLASASVPARSSVSEAAAARELPVVVIGGNGRWRRWWNDLLTYRGALYSLVRRNLRSRYKQAALGASWALLQPALQVVVFTVVFGRLGRIDSAGVPYPVFALAGLIAWNLFAKVIADGSASLVSNQHMITKLFFPRIYLVLASGASALVDAAVGVGLLAILMVVYDVPVRPSIVLGVPLLAAVLLLAYGLAAFLAAVNARWRDVQHTMPFLIQVGMFLTPVIYPLGIVPERWQWLLSLNPLAGLVAGFRGAVLGRDMPPNGVLMTSFLMSAAVVVLGLWYFTRAERTIVDVV